MSRLGGRTVVVTRSADQAGRLADLLRAEGAAVVEVPLIEVRPAGALASVLGQGPWDWVVVTSPNGVAALAGAAGATLASLRVAVVGPGSAAALRDAGAEPALVPARAVAEGLLEAFPLPSGRRRVLVAQGDRARPVLVEGLRAAGWDVTAVVAYETVASTVDPAARAAVAGADAVTFTSGSTVDAFLDALGAAALPPVVVSIGPVTTEVATRRGVAVARTADPHTLEGLVAATVEALA